MSMTFAQYVLKTRERLYDVRDASGVLITDASKDGIRWSSILLQEVCTNALHQLLRTLVSLDLDNYYNESTLNVITTGSIILGTGMITVETVVDDEKIYKIMMIQEVNDRKSIYSFVKADKFFDALYRQGLDVQNKYYTSLSDPTDNTVIAKTNYIPSQNTPIEVAYKRTIDTILDITSSQELPFVHLDDLMLDLSEEQGRLIEHNPTQLQSVQAVIKGKMELLTLERKQR